MSPYSVKEDREMRSVLFAFGYSLCVCMSAVAEELCYEDIAQLGETVPSLVSRSSSIGLVRVESIRDAPDDRWQGDNVVFEVSILSELKDRTGGTSTKLLNGVRAIAQERSDYVKAIRDHNDLAESGYRVFDGTTKLRRLRTSTRCEYVPSLVIGQVYLAFLPPPYTAKSFEPIDDWKKDAWLRSIVAEVAAQDSLRIEGLDPLSPKRVR